MHLYHGTVVHISTKNDIDKIIFRCKPFIYKQFQAVSDRLISLKTPKMAQKHAFFASKNSKKAPFLFILAQKAIKITAFWCLKSPFLSIFKNIWYNPGCKIF
jgi:hypothetical protein